EKKTTKKQRTQRVEQYNIIEPEPEAEKKKSERSDRVVGTNLLLLYRFFLISSSLLDRRISNFLCSTLCVFVSLWFSSLLINTKSVRTRDFLSVTCSMIQLMHSSPITGFQKG